jgi:hypothetical protein
MSAATAVSTSVARPALRTLLRVDAALCAASGVIGLAAARPVADLLGLDGGGWVAGVGAFLVLYAGGLWTLARARPAITSAGAAVTAVGDGIWVLATLALIAAGVFSGAGVATMVAVAVPVGALGVAKARARRALSRRAPGRRAA